VVLQRGGLGGSEGSPGNIGGGGCREGGKKGLENILPKRTRTPKRNIQGEKGPAEEGVGGVKKKDYRDGPRKRR